jgi:hypothetical protein
VGCRWDRDSIAQSAASSGSIKLVEWLRQQHGIAFDSEALSWAADAGQIAMCEYLCSTGCEWHANACCYTAESGRLEMLCWLRKHGCPWDVSKVLTGAARFGHANVLDYIIEQAAVLDSRLLTKALDHAGLSNRL